MNVMDCHVWVIVVVIVLFVCITFRSWFHNRDVQNMALIIETSGYFESFNATDLAVRGCKSSNKCKQRYINGLRKPSIKEGIQLQKLCKSVDEKLRKFGYTKLADISWKFIMFSESSESGFPHTHGDTICLPYNFIMKRHEKSLKNTLLHEKIHVFQRLYPLETITLFLDYWGFQVVGVHNLSSAHDENNRSNPDANRIRFKDNEGILIRSDFMANAKTIDDIVDRRDHPNEMMAYALADYMFNTVQRYEDELVMSLLQWAKVYLS